MISPSQKDYFSLNFVIYLTPIKEFPWFPCYKGIINERKDIMLNIDVDTENAEEEKKTVTIGLSIMAGTLLAIVLIAVAVAYF